MVVISLIGVPSISWLTVLLGILVIVPMLPLFLLWFICEQLSRLLPLVINSYAELTQKVFSYIYKKAGY